MPRVAPHSKSCASNIHQEELPAHPAEATGSFPGWPREIRDMQTRQDDFTAGCFSIK